MRQLLVLRVSDCSTTSCAFNFQWDALHCKCISISIYQLISGLSLSVSLAFSRFFLHFPGTVLIIFSIHPVAVPSGLCLIGSQIIGEFTDHIISHSLGLTPRSLHEPSKEQIIAVFSAASWFPQNSMFFLDMTSGLRAFSQRLLSMKILPSWRYGFILGSRE